MQTPIRIFIEELHGARYSARLDSPSGPIIVESTSQPLLDGSRALMAIGITGPVEMWDAKRPYPRMRGDIERLAALTVDEKNRAFGRWKAFSPSAVPRRTAKRDAGPSHCPERGTALHARQP